MLKGRAMVHIEDRCVTCGKPIAIKTVESRGRARCRTCRRAAQVIASPIAVGPSASGESAVPEAPRGEPEPQQLSEPTVPLQSEEANGLSARRLHRKRRRAFWMIGSIGCVLVAGVIVLAIKRSRSPAEMLLGIWQFEEESGGLFSKERSQEYRPTVEFRAGGQMVIHTGTRSVEGHWRMDASSVPPSFECNWETPKLDHFDAIEFPTSDILLLRRKMTHVTIDAAGRASERPGNDVTIRFRRQTTRPISIDSGSADQAAVSASALSTAPVQVLGRVAYEAGDGKPVLAVVLKVRRSELMPTEDEFRTLVAEVKGNPPRSRECVQTYRSADFTIRIGGDVAPGTRLLCTNVFLIGAVTRMEKEPFDPREWELLAVGVDAEDPMTGVELSVQHRSGPTLRVPVTKAELPHDPAWYRAIRKINLPPIKVDLPPIKVDLPIKVPPVKLDIPSINVPQIKAPNVTAPGASADGTSKQTPKKSPSVPGKKKGTAKDAQGKLMT